MSSCPTPVASILQDLTVGLTSPVWHPSITQLVLSVSTGSQQQVLGTGSLFLPSVEDNVQDSEKTERGLAFCSLQELESVVGMRMSPHPKQPHHLVENGRRLESCSAGQESQSEKQAPEQEDSGQAPGGDRSSVFALSPHWFLLVFPLTQGQKCFW